MKYSVSAIVLGFFAAFNAAAPTPDDKPDPGQVTVTGVNYAGSGCKAGTAHISNSPDWATFTILFDDYEATIGPGTGIADHVKNCNLNFKVNYPPGYQYTLYKNVYTGDIALLELGVTAKQTSSYWFAGFVNFKPTFQSTWYGPFDGQYNFTDTLASLIYSPCGNSTTLNINTQLVLTSSNPKAQGLINYSTLDIMMFNKYQHAYGVKWRRCS